MYNDSFHKGLGEIVFKKKTMLPLSKKERKIEHPLSVTPSMVPAHLHCMAPNQNDIGTQSEHTTLGLVLGCASLAPVLSPKPFSF